VHPWVHGRKIASSSEPSVPARSVARCVTLPSMHWPWSNQTSPMSADEAQLRQRLANVTTNRPALEAAVKDTTEILLALFSEAAKAMRDAEATGDASALPELQRRVEDVTRMTTAAAAAVQQLDVIETQLRQGIAQMTAERQAEAATRAAHSAAWAAWAVVIATSATVIATVGVALWDHGTTAPAPALIVESPAN
jgi:hypothetical protein